MTLCGELQLPRQEQMYLEKAARTGHVNSMNALALRLRKEGNDHQALHWLKEAYARGDCSAANILGILYIEGKCVPKDLQKGYTLLLTAASRGSRAAHRHLGRLYLGCFPGAEEFPWNPKQALLHLNQAREMGAVGDEPLIHRAQQLLDKKSEMEDSPCLDMLIPADEIP